MPPPIGTFTGKGTLADLERQDAAKAKAYIESKGAPIVVKTDGLAAGKGVIVAMEIEDALNAVDDMLSGAMFGSAGEEIVVEKVDRA